LLVDGFFTKLEDVFLLEQMGGDDKTLLYERRNGSGASVYGVSVEARVVPSAKWNIQLGATIQQSQYDEPEWGWTEDPDAVLRRKTGKEMFRSPNSYGYLTVGYEPIRRLNLSLSGTYTGRMWMQHCAGYVEHDEEVRTPAFFDMNFKVSYDFLLKGNSTLQVNAGVQNILNSFQRDFDKGSERDGGYCYGPSLPRSYFLGVKFSL
jgi:outer membrane receptor for ferrienterochelin and colicins